MIIITFELMAALAVLVTSQAALVVAVIILRRSVDRLERVAGHHRR
jgi:hypothetical protein